MRYLKRFNEELKVSTYKSAGDKFTKMGHKRRGSELLDYATEVEFKEKSKNLLQAQNENKEFGLFDITLTTGYREKKTDLFSGEFYLQMCLEGSWFEDQLCDWLADGMSHSIGLSMEFAIIPKDDETLKMIETSEDKNVIYFRNNSMFSDYRFWTNRLWLTLINKDLEPAFSVGSFEMRDNNLFILNSRAEAMKFKRLLVETFDKNLNWSSYGGITISDQFKKTCIIDQFKWEKLLMLHYLPGREDKYDLTNPDTWPKNPFTEDVYMKAADAFKRMSVNGLYKD